MYLPIGKREMLMIELEASVGILIAMDKTPENVATYIRAISSTMRTSQYFRIQLKIQDNKSI